MTGQVEPKGTVCYPTRGLRRNGDNGTPTQKILLEYRLSYGGTAAVLSWGYMGISGKGTWGSRSR